MVCCWFLVRGAVCTLFLPCPPFAPGPPAMSNIYNTEPPTSGKVLLSTSKGEIEIELWAKECPKACRNFIALALEGYYDAMIWHRIVPGFCVQSGDPTGTGTGGESFYGEPFQDEPHQRLRFNRRGLLAMANPGERDHNESQFFITLDATPELQNRHTLFGRISGPTIYNLLALSEVELSETEPDRPVFPPKLHSIKVVENPFDDIVPRITREERRAQEANKRRAKLEAGKRREKVKKNTGLLSFGEAEEDTGVYKKTPMSSHDLLKNDKRLRKEVAPAGAQAQQQPQPSSSSCPPAADEPRSHKNKKRKANNDDDTNAPIDLSTLRSKHAIESQGSKSTSAQIAQLEASIRGLSSSGANSSTSTTKSPARKGKQLLEAVRRKYKDQQARSKTLENDSGTKKKNENETMDMLKKFQMGGGEIRKRTRVERQRQREREDIEQGMREYGSDGSDDDDDWRKSTFKATTKEEHDNNNTDPQDQYVTLDPRDTSSSSYAARLGFGTLDDRNVARQEMNREMGRRGRDWVDVRGSGDRRRSGNDRDAKDDRRRIANDRHRDRDRDRAPRHVERW